MTAVAWHPTRDALAAALATAVADDLTVGQAQQARLLAFGGAYDSCYLASPAADAAKAAAASVYGTALAVWTPSAAASHVQADKSARYCEQLALAAQATTAANPNVFGSGLLLPTVAIPFVWPELPTAQASASIASATATIEGTVNLQVVSLAALASTRFNVIVTLGATSTPHVVTFATAPITTADLVAVVQAAVGSNVIATLDNGRLLLAVRAQVGGTVVALAVEYTADMTYANALGVLGFPVGGLVVNGATNTLVFTASTVAALGVLGNQVTVKTSDASNGAPDLFDVTASLGTYVESFANCSATSPPSFTGSRLLTPLVSLIRPAVRPPNQTLTLAGGAGQNRALLTARLAAALKYPTTTTPGPLATLSAHEGLFASWVEETPEPVVWRYQTAIPTAGVSALVTLTAAGMVDVYALEQALLVEVQATNDYLTELAS